MDRARKTHTRQHPKTVPGIHWFLVLAVLILVPIGLLITHQVTSQIDANIVQNQKVVDLTNQVARNAQIVHEQIVPAVNALHALDAAVVRHLSELELFILDPDRNPALIKRTLTKLGAAFDQWARTANKNFPLQIKELKETVDIFTDITEEVFEEKSPNKRLQLLSDSEDLLQEFRIQLAEATSASKKFVLQSGQQVADELENARHGVSLQAFLLTHLENYAIGSLVLLFLLLLSGGFLLTRVLQRRLKAVANYAQTVAEGNYDSDIGFTSADILGKTAESVHHMGNRLAALVQESQTKADIALKAQKEALKLASFDTLTGLPNRQHFLNILTASLDQARANEERLGVVYMDLDDFKKINDSFGHAVGDSLLCAVAERLQNSLRESDLIAPNSDGLSAVMMSRLGGDEFTFIITHSDSQADFEKVARRVLNALIQPYQVGEREFVNQPSLGIAIFPDHGESADDLLQKADMAMYDAKKSGHNNIELYSKELGDKHLDRLRLERELIAAIEQNQLLVYYQPKVDTVSREIVGAEALLRWHHPDQGMISPADFIPIAEESGLIDQIGDWVLQQVLTQVAQWQQQGIPSVPVSINVSAKQITTSGFVDSIRRGLAATAVPPEQIELELTESVLMQDADLTAETLKAVHLLGIQTSLDDFGTGYSSLGYLKQLQLHTLKIDRSFVKDIEHDPDSAAIVTAILSLASHLGIHVVAEGVENEHQLEILRRQGCQTAQGFFFSKAVPADEFSQQLLTRHPSTAGKITPFPYQRQN